MTVVGMSSRLGIALLFLAGRTLQTVGRSLNGIHYMDAFGFNAVSDSGVVDAFKIIEVMIRISDSGTCGGTIVSPTHVLTAAHCILPQCDGRTIAEMEAEMTKPADITVFVEGTCVDKQTHDCSKHIRTRPVKVREVHVPAAYAEQECTSNDIAVLVLDEDVGNKGARLATADPAIGKNLFVSAYGYDPLEDDATEHLLKTVNLTVKACDKDSAFDDSVCTVELDKDACEGDSGAALKDHNDVLYGIVSFGTECVTIVSALQNAHAAKTKLHEFLGGVFTSVKYHRGFICDLIGAEYGGCGDTPFTRPSGKIWKTTV